MCRASALGKVEFVAIGRDIDSHLAGHDFENTVPFRDFRDGIGDRHIGVRNCRENLMTRDG